jgi:hypothetical protein
MSKSRHLRDAYRQPGFVPQATLRSLHSDPFAFVVSLVRSRKKLGAECAAAPIGASTINGRIGRATSIVPSTESSFCSFFEECSVEVAVR